MEVHHLLHLTGCIDTLWTGSRNRQRPQWNLPAARCQNQLRKRDLPVTGQMRRFIGFYRKHRCPKKQSNRFREILHKRSGVFPSGKSGAKTGMAALQENAAQLLFSLHQRNAFASGIRCGSNSRCTTADNQDIKVPHA